MKPDLSIIMPCFDCAETLREAVDSCYAQGLKSFELVMVDDCSTDSTADIMAELAKEHDNIRTFKNDQNLGGGATRNRAVAETRSDVIFCLDSDDVLPPHTLSRMLSYLKEHSLDGLGFEHCVKFIGKNLSNIDRVDAFDFAGQNVPVSSLLEKKDGVSCPLYINFMYTRKAFDIMGGYPTHHGFDTQGFAWRFLMNGLKAQGCPGSSYLQRIKFKRSYYLREYESGKANRNWFEILSECMWAFDPQAQAMILGYDLHDPFSAIFDDIRALPQVFADPMPQPPRMTESDLTPPEQWWIARSLFGQGKYNDAKIILKELEARGIAYPSIPRLIEGCELGIKGLSMPEIRLALDVRERFVQRGSVLPLHKKILRRARKLIRIIRKKI
jgi:glycosyltransferase involved in cell wall biosynthesis